MLSKRIIALASLGVLLMGCRLEVTTNGLVYENSNFGGLHYHKLIKNTDGEAQLDISTGKPLEKP